MRAVVSPGRVSGSIVPPPSKSHFQRVCASALLRKGRTRISGGGNAADDLAALQAIQALGAQVKRHKNPPHDTYVVSNGVLPANSVVDCGESGLAARLFIPIAALANERIMVTGHGSLLQRPIGNYDQVLPELGATVESRDGFLPFTVQGPLQARDVSVDGSHSSQTVSGLLFALSASARQPVTLLVENPVSAPYIRMTIEVLQHFGRRVQEKSPGRFVINPALPDDAGEVYVNIEGDWSGVAPMLVAGATCGDLEIEVPTYNRDCHADAALLDLLDQMNADLDWDGYGLDIADNLPLSAFLYNAIHSPDLIPILAVLGAACDGESRIGGLHRLVHKESNRAETTSYLLGQMGIPYRIDGDELLVTGKSVPRSCTIDGHNDHRIVMAAAIAALRADGPVTIEGAEAVRKSYPDFFDDLRKLGVKVELTD